MRGHYTAITIAKDELQSGRGGIFLAISAGWFLSIGVRHTYPVLIPYLRTEYDLSLTVVGSLLTVMWLSYAVGQIPGGILADKFGEQMTMAGSMILSALTLVMVITAESALMLFAGTVALGFSVALFGVVRLTTLAKIYPDHVGSAQGILGATGDVGNTLLPPLAGVAAAVAIWQAGFGLFIPLFVVVGVLIWMFVPKLASATSDGNNIFSFAGLRNLLSELTRPSIILITTIQIIGFSIHQAFVGFYPTYLIEMKGISAAVAGGFLALFFALGVLFRPISGIAYDRVGARSSLLVMTSVSGVALVALPLVDGFLPLFVTTLVIGFMTGKGTITLAYMTEALPSDVQNTGLGAIRTTFFMIGATSPLLFGAIADRGHFNEAFFLLAGLSGLTVVFIMLLTDAEER